MPNYTTRRTFFSQALQETLIYITRSTKLVFLPTAEAMESWDVWMFVDRLSNSVRWRVCVGDEQRRLTVYTFPDGLMNLQNTTGSKVYHLNISVSIHHMMRFVIVCWNRERKPPHISMHYLLLLLFSASESLYVMSAAPCLVCNVCFIPYCHAVITDKLSCDAFWIIVMDGTSDTVKIGGCFLFFLFSSAKQTRHPN